MHILAYALVMNIPLTQLLEILQLVLLVGSPGHVKDVRLRIATHDVLHHFLLWIELQTSGELLRFLLIYFHSEPRQRAVFSQQLNEYRLMAVPRINQVARIKKVPE